MWPCFGPPLTILEKNLPGRAQGGQGGRMVITREPVGRFRSFKAETHSLTKSIGVFEAQISDLSTPKGGYSGNQVAQGGQQPYFQEIDLPM